LPRDAKGAAQDCRTTVTPVGRPGDRASRAQRSRLARGGRSPASWPDDLSGDGSPDRPCLP
jgi:hypothetical protein